LVAVRGEIFYPPNIIWGFPSMEVPPIAGWVIMENTIKNG